MATVESLTARLEGSIVALEPLREEHAEELWEAAQAPEIWGWLAHLNRRDRFDLWLRLTLEAAHAGAEGRLLQRHRLRVARGPCQPRMPSCDTDGRMD